jgi:AAA domain
MRTAFREDWSDGTTGEWSVPGDDAKPETPLIEFKSPLELKNFVPPPGIELVGDYHITKGSTAVEGGPPGVGKSRGLTALAYAGATKTDWFGYKVHRQFKTMIVQTENGLFRLWKEFSGLDCDAIDDHVRICPPRPYGLCFKREDFRKQLAAAINEFKPDIVGFDPWNAAAREQDSKEYLDTFAALKSVLPLGDDAPALIIVAHTRKPKPDERASGRTLLNLLAGSYVLGSVPRTVFIMQAASDDVNDNRVVWTCCKNNDGELGNRSAWERRNGLFVPVEFFDFNAFDHPPKETRGLKPEILRELLMKNRQYDKSQVVAIIIDETGCQKSTAYNLTRKAVKKGVLRYHKTTKIYELA